jgi:hypothetical protein
MKIVADDGTLLFDKVFNSGELGTELAFNAYLLTPDGVLYVVATGGLYGPQAFAAIEVGIGAGSTWVAPWSGFSGNWARDNATWHSTPAP